MGDSEVEEQIIADFAIEKSVLNGELKNETHRKTSQLPTFSKPETEAENIIVPQKFETETKNEIQRNDDDSEIVIHCEIPQLCTYVKSKMSPAPENSKDECTDDKLLQTVANEDSVNQICCETSWSQVYSPSWTVSQIILPEKVETETKKAIRVQPNNDDSEIVMYSETSQLCTSVKSKIAPMSQILKDEIAVDNLIQPTTVNANCEQVVHSETLQPPICENTELATVPHNLNDESSVKRMISTDQNTNISFDNHLSKDKYGAIYCNLCCRKVPFFHRVEQHLKGIRHRKNEELLNATRKTLKKNDFDIEKLKINDSTNSHVQSCDEDAGISGIHELGKEINAESGLGSGGTVTPIWTVPEIVSNASQLEDADKNKSDLNEIEYEDVELQDDDTYLCTICGIYTLNKILLKSHLIGKKHRKNMTLKSSPDYPWNKVIELQNGKVDHIQMVNSDHFKCLLCNIKKMQRSALFAHLNGYDHQLALKKMCSDRSEDITAFRLQHIWNEIFLAERGKWHNIYFLSGDTFRCTPCKVLLCGEEVVSHVRSERHLDLINDRKQVLKNVELQKQFYDVWNRISPAIRTHETHFCMETESTMFCTACNVKISASVNNVSGHVTGKSHMKLVVTHLLASPEVSLGMKTCVIESSSLTKSQEVSPSLTAQESLLMALEPQDVQKKPPEKRSKEEQVIEFDCLFCPSKIDGVDGWYRHICTEKHMRTIDRLQDEDKDLNMRKCLICNANVLCIGNDMRKHECMIKINAPKETQIAKECEEINQIKEDSSKCYYRPRIMVTGYPKAVNLEQLYKLFMDFGAISYAALTPETAVIEFNEREAVDRAVKNPPSIEGIKLIVEVLNQRVNKGQLNDTTNLQEDILSVFQSVDTLNRKLEALIKLNSNVYNPQISTEISEFLERVLRKSFSNCKAYCFGSRVSELAFPDSDMDIFLDTGNMYDGNEQQGAFIQEYMVSVTYEILKKHSECDKVISVPKARTPIVKFFHKPTGLHCDIAFRHGLGVENTKLIKYYLSLDKNVKPLILFLKHWAGLNDLIGPHSITNYALSWLAIFYLQQEIELPSVDTLLKHYEGDVKSIAGWDCSFCLDKKIYQPKQGTESSIVELLYGFFNYYCIFEYRKHVVCPLTGTTVDKRLFTNEKVDELPQAMDNYVYRVTHQKHAERFRCLASMCVQDPFDLSHNLTKAVSSAMLRKFVILCGKSADLCVKLL